VREPPVNISIAELSARLRDQYRLAVAGLDFLPIGHDSSAWVYRVRTADAGTYFLKVRTSLTNEASLLVPHYLRDRGIAQVVAPLPTGSGQLSTYASKYALILYPFVAGPTGMEHGMSTQQWIDFGALTRQIHATVVPSDLALVLQRDPMTPTWANMVRKVDGHIGARTFDDSAAQSVATFWQTHRPEILTLLQRAEELGPRVAGANPEFVLCHADLHTNNVLLDAEERVWIIDWDETILAPRERDLMFVVGGIKRGFVAPREEALFFQGYGSTSIDQVALAYYRCCWAVQDIGSYAEQVFFRPDLGPPTRQAAVDRFISLFAPDSIVAIAFASPSG
jgi:spectinomycin phosphotransferase